MPMSLQVKLLRVLQERRIERVGEIEPRPLDIRVVSATNKDLEEEIKEGNFREDLFYRLNEVCFELPPLRNRGSDIYELAMLFHDQIRPSIRIGSQTFSSESVESMTAYQWYKCAAVRVSSQKALALSETAQISVEDMGLQTVEVKTLRSLETAVDDFKMEYVRQALEVNNWNKSQTARVLDVDPANNLSVR